MTPIVSRGSPKSEDFWAAWRAGGDEKRELREFFNLFTYPHISGWGTHHGRCWGGHDGVGEGGEGVLVRVLVGVLVLMLVLVLVLVELGAQVGRRAQRGPAIGTLGGQEARVELLAQKVLF